VWAERVGLASMTTKVAQMCEGRMDGLGFMLLADAENGSVAVVECS
jgi:hypothetical protein